jgi:hypothetical protein
MFPSSELLSQSASEDGKGAYHTLDLFLKPIESRTIEFHMGCAIREIVCNIYFDFSILHKHCLLRLSHQCQGSTSRRSLRTVSGARSELKVDIYSAS